jgi:hypothetical protein
MFSVITDNFILYYFIHVVDNPETDADINFDGTVPVIK